MSALVSLGASAGIPEPDVVYYGALRIDGVLQGAASAHQIELQQRGSIVASYVLGSLPGAGDLYVLRVPVESAAGGPLSPGRVLLGSEARVLVDGVPAAHVYLGARGRVTRMDLSAASDLARVPDFDGDGIPDFEDLCWLSASQADRDGNGIGDACEGLVNPGLHFVPVDGVSNPRDPATGKGSVPYLFAMGDAEVTNADYVEFLNAIAAEDPHRLYSEAMASDPRGGIVRMGEARTYSYKVKPNMANKPVNFVSWLDAARYANWLANGKPQGGRIRPGAPTTETGAFDLTVPDPGVNATSQLEAGNSLPTEDEWYKAAFFDPVSTRYWRYATAADVAPTPAQANGIGDVTNAGSNVANYLSRAVWAGQVGNVTSVATAGASSAFGTWDQAGNVSEWLANDAEMGMRVVRGGSYRDTQQLLVADADLPDRSVVLRDPAYEGPDVGFRIVAVPEAGAALGIALAGAVLALWSRRRQPASQRRPWHH